MVIFPNFFFNAIITKMSDQIFGDICVGDPF